MYGPPGTGKTLLARACAAQTDATFLKLAGPQLVQMFIGDGAKLVRDCFALAKEKAPAIIFIDELDAVGTKRFDSEKSGDREVQRTMLELLNQLDGFASDDRIKVLAATNRVDVLDPALLRSGRLDRKIEFPLPNEEARAQILKIHSRKMKVDPNVNWGELARSTDEFGGAMLKAVCVEAGMIALRMGKNKISHEHYVDAIAEVQAKKKEVSVPQDLSNSPTMNPFANPLHTDRQLLRLIIAIQQQNIAFGVARTNIQVGMDHRLQTIDEAATLYQYLGLIASSVGIASSAYSILCPMIPLLVICHPYELSRLSGLPHQLPPYLDLDPVASTL